MAKKVLLSLALLALVAAPAASQNAMPDAKAVLQRADAAMGVSKATSLQISATGYVTALGQNYSSALDETWPRFELKSFTRTIDFPSNSMREDQTRVQGPIIGERHQKQLVSGNYAWNLNDEGVAQPQVGQAEMRQLELIMTPHG